MSFADEIVLAFITGCIGAIIWFVRLEGRVNLLDRIVTDFISDRRQALQAVISHIDRLEGKVDKMSLRVAALHPHFNRGLAAEDAGDDSP